MLLGFSRQRTAIAAIGLLAMALVVTPGPIAAAGSLASADQLYVTNGALDEPAAAPNVGRFTIDAAGRVAPAGTALASRDARGIVFTPKPDAAGRRFAYVSSLGAGLDEFGGIDRYQVAANGALTYRDTTPTSQPFGIAISPNGRTIYVANFDFEAETGSISAFHVGAAGALTPLGEPKPSGTAHPKGIAVTPDGRFLYVGSGTPLDPAPAMLTGFRIGTDGSVQNAVSQANIGATGHRVVITPDGRFVYATSQDQRDAPDVFGFQIDSYGGLTPVPGKPSDAGRWVEGAAVSPDGRRLYVTALHEVGEPQADGQIRAFAIGADGRLTEIAHIDSGRDPVDLAFGLSGQRLYVSDFADSNVTVFSLDQSGSLTPIQTLGSQGSNPGFQSVAVQAGR